WSSQLGPAEPGEPLVGSTVVPLINQITTCPVFVFCQRMSLLPSALKSPVSKMCQGLVAEPGEPPPITVVPFNSQITTCPLVVLYQRMSVLPSPLKSPVRMGTHWTMGAEPGEPPPMTLAPSISQITTCPVRCLYQMMSPWPSPLTSPVPGAPQSRKGAPDPGEPPPMTLSPSISQITTCPVLMLCQRMSPLPSPSKSPMAPTIQSVDTV